MNTSQTQRIHKVETRTRLVNGALLPSPRLRLAGKWLAQWGFPDGAKMHLLKEISHMSIL
jgi:hypothetical protein